MDSRFLADLKDLADRFYRENTDERYTPDISGFKNWIAEAYQAAPPLSSDIQPGWEGREYGRTPESVITTLIVHLNRYANRYSEAAIAGSEFTTQDDFVYLINLEAFGQMTKEQLIRSNVQDTADGSGIIARLESNHWIETAGEDPDGRSGLIQISEKGKEALQNQMGRIRKATSLVAGDLSHHERIELIKILTKLELHHQSVFNTCGMKDLIRMMQ